MAKRIVDGRASRVWQERHPSSDAWVQAIAEEVGLTANLLRRWASAYGFEESISGDERWPPAEALSGRPFYVIELLARADRIDRPRARELAHQLARGELRNVQVRDIVDEMARQPASSGDRWLGFLRSMGEERQLREGRWPDRFVIGAPDAVVLGDDLRVAIVEVRDDRNHGVAAKLRWAVAGASLCTSVWLIGRAAYQVAFVEAASLLDRMRPYACRNVGIALVGEDTTCEIVVRATRDRVLDDRLVALWQWASPPSRS